MVNLIPLLQTITVHSFPQTIGSEENQGLADFGVKQYYGWRRVIILPQDVDIFEKVKFITSSYQMGHLNNLNMETFDVFIYSYINT